MELSGKRVLIIEDEPLVALDLEFFLADQGTVVVGPAPTVGRALELIDETRIDIAILDLMLNGERSDVVAARLTEQNVPFVVVSGYGRAEGFNATHFIEKPYSTEQITQALVTALQEKDCSPSSR